MAAARKADAELLAIRRILGNFDDLPNTSTKQIVLNFVVQKIQAEIDNAKAIAEVTGVGPRVGTVELNGKQLDAFEPAEKTLGLPLGADAVNAAHKVA